MNPIVERTELERAQRVLRTLSIDLAYTAPAVAMKAGALARECELRLDDLNRRAKR